MAGIVLLNAVLAIFILTVILGLCTWGIIADLRHRRGERLPRHAVSPAGRRLEPSRSPRPELGSSPQLVDSAA